MKLIIRSFLIFLLFFLLSLPVVAFANHIATLVLYKPIVFQNTQSVKGVSLSPIPTPKIGNGDADMNNKVDFQDVDYISNNWNHSASGVIDQYQDGKINAFDFAVIADNFNQ